MFISILNGNQCGSSAGCSVSCLRGRDVSTPGVHTLCVQCEAVAQNLWTKTVLKEKVQASKTHNQIKVARREEMRLRLIMGLGADVLHESNSTAAKSVSMATESVIIEPKRPPSSLPTRWRLMNMNCLQPITRSFFLLLFFQFFERKNGHIGEY